MNKTVVGQGIMIPEVGAEREMSLGMRNAN